MSVAFGIGDRPIEIEDERLEIVIHATVVMLATTGSARAHREYESMLFFLVLGLAVPHVAPTPALTPERMLGLVRARFRAHRPPPPLEAYTVQRKQDTSQGYPDYAGSYTDKLWCRTVDRACLKRRVYRSVNRGELTFERPAFNEDRDPGPPTADLFEPAPQRAQSRSFVPTPEPATPAPSASQPPLIGIVRTLGVFDYRVVSLRTEGDVLHFKIEPTRDPDRNRLREIFADRRSYELERVIATDKLFIPPSNDVYPVVFDIKLGMLRGVPIVTDIHGVVGGGYQDDGATVDYSFRNIDFPATLPDWYFDARKYTGHDEDAPI